MAEPVKLSVIRNERGIRERRDQKARVLRWLRSADNNLDAIAVVYVRRTPEGGIRYNATYATVDTSLINGLPWNAQRALENVILEAERDS